MIINKINPSERKNQARQKARQKAETLVAEMTIEEKVLQLVSNASAIDRLQIKEYHWWGEALHGVARAGVATVFPQAIGLAAMFDEVCLTEVAETIALEARAKYNSFQQEKDYDIYKGLTMWSPNVNIFRDPRWGRGHETYGEDPFLSGKLGVAFIKGLQGDGDILKVAACAKHFAVHSGPEAKRHQFNVEVSEKDLWETYLPAFYDCVVEGDVEAVMGAYNRVNGEPCCGSYRLLDEILRQTWGFSGHVVSDCWALKDFHMHHRVTATPSESVALALKAGCDLNCGNLYLNLLMAYREGLVEEKHITQACERLYTTRCYLGMFQEETPYDALSLDIVDCKTHNQLALKSAEKSLVLLKNQGNSTGEKQVGEKDIKMLPLQKEKLKTIGVIGPNAASIPALQGNYYGTSSQYVTFLQGIQNEVEPEDIRVFFAEGCHIFKDRTEALGRSCDRIKEAVAVARCSDVVVLCLGLDEKLEGEEGDEGNAYTSGDKADLQLPLSQRQLLEAILAVGTKVVLVVAAGSALDLNYAYEHPNCQAILWAWYAGARGGEAVANVLFGKVSPAGKLPVTFYKDENQLPDFEDYSMANRTYKNFQGEVLFPFGFGLTYGDVEVKKVNLVVPPKASKCFPIQNIKSKDRMAEKDLDLVFEMEIGNDSSTATEDVIQIYVKDLESPWAPIHHSLVGFKRIVMAGEQSQKVTINVPFSCLGVVDEQGNKRIDSHTFCFYVGTSQPDPRSEELLGHSAVKVDLVLS